MNLPYPTAKVWPIAYLSAILSKEFITRVSNLMDVRVLQEIVNYTLLRVREFPVFGKLHFEILNRCYLSSVGYQEDDILFELEIERSMYYDRKKEILWI